MFDGVKKKHGLAAVAFLLITACATVQLVSNYDEITDREVTALQRSVDDTLIALESMSTPQCLHASHLQFYTNTHSAIRSLQLRNQARGEKNRQTTEQVDILRDSFDTFEALHEGNSNKNPPVCMTRGDIDKDLRGLNATFRAILTLELAKKRGP